MGFKKEKKIFSLGHRDFVSGAIIHTMPPEFSN
jgi:hypothetical protein